MIVSFSRRDLRDLCQAYDRANQEFGPSVAQALFRLLAEIEAAETIEEVVSLYVDAAKFGEGDSLLVAFASECEARFEAVQAQRTLDGCGRLDWSKVRRLKLTQVKVGPDA